MIARCGRCRSITERDKNWNIRIKANDTGVAIKRRGRADTLCTNRQSMRAIFFQAQSRNDIMVRILRE
jgi:hypothetical protein